MAIIKWQQISAGKDLKKWEWTLMLTWWECKVVYTWNSSELLTFFKKLKIEVPYPAIPLTSIFPRKTKTLIQKDICIPMFNAALFSLAKLYKQPKCPWWMDKEWGVFVCDEILLSHKKEWNIFTCKNIEGVMLSEISQTENDKYHVILLICGT